MFGIISRVLEWVRYDQSSKVCVTFLCSAPNPFSAYFSRGCGTASNGRRLVYTTRMRENCFSKCKISLPWDGGHPHPDPPPARSLCPLAILVGGLLIWIFDPPPPKKKTKKTRGLGRFIIHNSPSRRLALNNGASSLLLVRKQGALASCKY